MTASMPASWRNCYASIISSRLPWRDGCAHAARAGPELSNPDQRSDPSHESPEGDVSQLGHSLSRPGRLLHPSSRRVAGKDPGGGCAPSGRASLPATGYVATLAPASSARTASGKSEAFHHRQATADSVARTHSLGTGGSADPDPASFSHQAPAVGLQWTGIRNSH